MDLAMQKDVFLSYGHGDKQFVRRIARNLTDNGITVWIDEEEILAGDSLIERIRGGIESVRFFVVVISENSIRSRWVRSELDIAMNKEIEGKKLRVIPILLGPISDEDLPSFLVGKRFVDCRRHRTKHVYDKALKELVKAIGARDQLVSSDSDRIEPDSGSVQTDAPERLPHRDRGAFWVGESILAWILGVARTKVHRLLVVWLQLVLATFIFSAIGGEWVGQMLVFSMLVVLPLSIAISRLVHRNIVMSILAGGLVIAVVEGGLAYAVREWAVKTGILYGTFFGASLTSYFSDRDKETSLTWATIITSVLIGILLVLECSSGVSDCLETIGHFIGNALEGAGFAIVFGFVLLPVITPLTRFIEFIIEGIMNLGKSAS
jgi:TIR domain-containing protein